MRSEITIPCCIWQAQAPAGDGFLASGRVPKGEKGPDRAKYTLTAAKYTFRTGGHGRLIRNAVQRILRPGLSGAYGRHGRVVANCVQQAQGKSAGRTENFSAETAHA